LTDANAPPSSTNATLVPWIANSLFDAAGDRSVRAAHWHQPQRAD
jgi:hypothetical protein